MTPITDGPGYFYPTTLVADIDNDNPLVAEEQFGPALPIIRYSDLDEAVAMANGLDVGLGASVWGADPARPHAPSPPGSRPAPSGSTRTAVFTPMIPFGGVKKSGYGLEFGSKASKRLAFPRSSTADAHNTPRCLAKAPGRRPSQPTAGDISRT